MGRLAVAVCGDTPTLPLLYPHYRNPTTYLPIELQQLNEVELRLIESWILRKKLDPCGI